MTRKSRNRIKIADDLFADASSGEFSSEAGLPISPVVGTAILVDAVLMRLQLSSSALESELRVDAGQVRRWRAHEDAPHVDMRRQLMEMWGKPPRRVAAERVHWSIPVSGAQLAQYETNNMFVSLLQLGRLSNQLRFVTSAAIDLDRRADSAAFRQRLQACFFTAAVLGEGTKLLTKLEPSLAHLVHWEAFKAAVTGEYGPFFVLARNQAVYHFDPRVIQEGLVGLGHGETTFVEGDTRDVQDVHYGLADLAALAYTMNGLATNGGDKADVQKYVDASIIAASKIVAIIDQIVLEGLTAFGLHVMVEG